MQPPLIFVATSDLEFEATARNAVLNSYHGMRCVRDIREACQSLGMGTRDVALAIIDLDLQGRGGSLLHILGGCRPNFPILAITDSESQLFLDDSISEIAMASLLKPVKSRDLQRKIEELCQARDTLLYHNTHTNREEHAWLQHS